LWSEHDEFFKIASEKTLFAKVVFDKNITDEEIEKSAELCKKYDIELILQPKCAGDNIKPDMEFVEKLLKKFLSRYKKVRLIPQVHKFLNVR
jgi:organic radical activating enzyme